MWKVLSSILRKIGKKKVNRKVIPTSKALKLLKKSMKEYSKVYEKLSK